MMQDRLGPNRANMRPGQELWGITHFMADAVKFLFKEDFVPPRAHKFLFALAPILALAPALIVAAIIPFGPPLCWGQLFEVVPIGAVHAAGRAADRPPGRGHPVLLRHLLAVGLRRHAGRLGVATTSGRCWAACAPPRR